jgi:hypothetical protein
MVFADGALDDRPQLLPGSSRRAVEDEPQFQRGQHARYVDPPPLPPYVGAFTYRVDQAFSQQSGSLDTSACDSLCENFSRFLALLVGRTLTRAQDVTLAQDVAHYPRTSPKWTLIRYTCPPTVA